MTRTKDQIYFARRASEERERAKAAADLAIANAHFRLAQEYERRIAETDGAQSDLIASMMADARH